MSGLWRGSALASRTEPRLVGVISPKITE